MHDRLWISVFVIVYVIRWILPKLGVPTWASAVAIQRYRNTPSN
jgi:hypothetical protein